MKSYMHSSLLLIALTLSTLAFGQVKVEVGIDKHVSTVNGNDAQITITVSGGGTGSIIVEWNNKDRSIKDNAIIEGPSATLSFPAQGKKETPIQSGKISVKVIDVSEAPALKVDSVTIYIKEPTLLKEE